jgi:hypothetical protein
VAGDGSGTGLISGGAIFTSGTSALGSGSTIGSTTGGGTGGGSGLGGGAISTISGGGSSIGSCASTLSGGLILGCSSAGTVFSTGGASAPSSFAFLVLFRPYWLSGVFIVVFGLTPHILTKFFSK